MHEQRKHREVRFRNYRELNLEKCMMDFERVFKEFDKEELDINDTDFESKYKHLWLKWKKSFHALSNQHAPFKIARLKNRRNPWITNDILKLMYERDYAQKKASDSNDDSKSNFLWVNYRQLRNQVTTMVRSAKKEHMNNALNEHQSNGKKLWQLIRQIFPKDGKGCISDISCEMFNDYFSSIGSKVAGKLNSDKEYETHLKDSIYSFNFKMITAEFTMKYLSLLPEESKNDVLEFDTKLLRLTAPIISKSLTYMINLSVKSGICLEDWKIACVTPAYKGKGDKNEENNFRPLSVIGHLAKLVEKAVQLQLVDYLHTHKFISIDQFAYLKFHSTQLSLHRLIDDILENVNENEKTALCFLDIRKCFDTIDHKILLTKLQKYGIRNVELKWFESYLKERKQIVEFNGKKSSTKCINIGVPQGTILGPILFLLYVNDLSNAVSGGLINIYADDVVVYTSERCELVLKVKMQNIMNGVFTWYSNNRLSLSIEKCTTMVINNDLRKRVDNFEILLGDKPLVKVPSMQYLGVIIDDKLKWSEQALKATKKVSMNNGRIRKSGNSMPTQLKLKIHNSINVPVLDYANTVWGGFSKSNMNIITRVEHRAARMITGNYDYINTRGASLMNDLGMSSFNDRMNYQLSVLMYKAINGLVPDHIANMITFSHEVTQRNLRSRDNMILYKPKPNKEIYKSSLSYSGPEQWNGISLDVKNAPSVNCFKKRYKSVHF